MRKFIRGFVYKSKKDPHCYRTNKEPTISELCEEGWIRWCKTTELTEKSFYNLCLPL
uniref:Uncharacterized protein n=1 Tax=Trichobilharzia regenti TaxID=157069 RepID=A0AA85IK64_TRIRE|nr:unnamed protein product [Trichobilharzia regenti]